MGIYVESNLGKNEEIIKTLKINRLAIVPHLLKIILCAAFAFAIVFVFENVLDTEIPSYARLIINIGAIVICSLLAIRPFTLLVEILTLDIAITNKRIFGKAGLFRTFAIDIPLNQVSNAVLMLTFFGKIFNYATIEIRTTGMKIVNGNSCAHFFNGVSNSKEFLNAINEAVENNAEQQRVLQAEELAKAMKSNNE